MENGGSEYLKQYSALYKTSGTSCDTENVGPFHICLNAMLLNSL